MKLGHNPDLVSIFMETWSIFGPSFTKLRYDKFQNLVQIWTKFPKIWKLGQDYDQVSQSFKKNTKTGTCPTVLEIILSCFHQVRLNFIAENCYGLLFLFRLWFRR